MISRIRKPDSILNRAINRVTPETDPQPGPSAGTYHEGQLLALEQMITGSGIHTEQEDQAHLSTYDSVKPGGDAGWRGNPDIRRMVWVPLSLGWLTLSVTDSVYVASSFAGDFTPGSPLDAGWVVAFYLVGLAATAPAADTRREDLSLARRTPGVTR